MLGIATSIFMSVPMPQSHAVGADDAPRVIAPRFDHEDEHRGED